MSASILVAYATRYGSTQEVAETVAATLRESGLEVDLEQLRQVHSIDQYQAIVIGAPLYMFRWHKDALNFLSRFHTILITQPVAIFALGPFHANEEEFQSAREQLEKELEKFPWLHPKAIEIFGGKFDPEKLTFPHNLVPALKKMPASDVRDWTTIRAWANQLTMLFQPALTQAN